MRASKSAVNSCSAVFSSPGSSTVIATSPTLSSQPKLEQALQMPPPGFQPRANVGEHQRGDAFTLRTRPGLQPFDLDIEIRLLSMPAHPAIEHQQSPINFAHQALNLSTRHADFTTHRHGLDAARLNPATDGDGM